MWLSSIYRIQHDDDSKDNCKDLFVIHCQEENDRKFLRLHGDDDFLMLRSLSNEFPISTLQSAADCFRMGSTISQFPQLCELLTPPMSSVEDSEATYSSWNSLSFGEDDNALGELPVDANRNIDADGDNLNCQKAQMLTTNDLLWPKQPSMPSWETLTLP